MHVRKWSVPRFALSVVRAATVASDFTVAADTDKSEQGTFTLASGKSITSTSGNIALTATAFDTSNGTLTASSGIVTQTLRTFSNPAQDAQVDQAVTSTFATDFLENPQTGC